MADKIRLDVYLAENGLAESREKAKSFIMAGLVYVNGQKAVKAGDTLKPEDKVEVRGSSEFVSRGGHKLKKAVDCFGLNLENKICMDIGASTGGFTDCMLQNKAARVYSVDVGYGQLAWKLRTDPRVVNLERKNIRYDVTRETIGEELDFVSIDVSFISLTLVLLAARELMADEALCVALIKPQFEAGREKVGKKGVVREESTHIEVIEKIIAFARAHGFSVRGLDFSPIKGPEGNIEYLILLQKTETDETEIEISAAKTVRDSHIVLNENKKGGS